MASPNHIGTADVAELARVKALQIKRDDVKHAFRGKVRQQPDGKYTVNLSTKAEIQKMLEMRRPYARAMTELSLKRAEHVEKFRARDPRGQVRDLPISQESNAIKGGFVAVASYRSHSHVQTGPDGMLWRTTNAGKSWEPLGRCCLGTPVQPCEHPSCGACR